MSLQNCTGSTDDSRSNSRIDWFAQGSVSGSSRRRGASRSRGPTSFRGATGVFVAPVLNSAASDDGASVAWGGSASSSVFNGSALHSLLPSDNSDALLEEKFRIYTSAQEVGPARSFAASHADTCKPEYGSKGVKPERVWVFDDDMVMWKPVDFAIWALNVQSVFVDDLNMITNRIFERMRHWHGFDGKEADFYYKAWKSVNGQAMRALTMMNKVATYTNIATAAATLLRDDVFLTRLDAARHLVSFRNGVYDALTNEFRPRVREDNLAYALPYDYDEEAEQSDIRMLVSSMLEDADAEECFQVQMGYCFTGATTEKMFLQLHADPHSGKTSLLEVLVAAMGAYASYTKVPIHEISSATSFEDAIALACEQHPPPRMIAFDETGQNMKLNEQFINQASSGSSNIKLSLRMKHAVCVQVPVFHAKVVVSSNHVLTVPSSSSGTVQRIRGVPFKNYFPPVLPVGPLAPLNARARNPDLIRRLTSDEGRAGVAAYLLQGAHRFYRLGVPYSSKWEAQAFRLRTDGDPWLKWIAEYYTPTGVQSDRVKLINLSDEYKKHKGSRGGTEEGISCALASLSDFVFECNWDEQAQYGSGSVMVKGFAGLRPRLAGDPPFADAIASAKQVLLEMRDAVVAASAIESGES